MPTVTPALVQQTQVNIQGRFLAGLQAADPVYPSFVEVVTSTGRGEIYPFVSDMPAIEEWIGPRQYRQMKVAAWQIDNKHYESTLRINKDYVADSQMASFFPYAERLGRAARLYPDKLIAALIEAGFSTKCYDGQNYFSSSHPVGTGTASNTTASALSATTYAAGRAAMSNYQNDAGQPLGVVPDTLVVPPALEGTARLILNTDFVSDVPGGAGAGITNVWRGSANLVVLPWLTSATHWYLFSTKMLLPALIFQNRQDPQLVPRVNMNDDNVFNLNELIWGVDFRCAAGYGAWQCAYASSN